VAGSPHDPVTSPGNAKLCNSSTGDYGWPRVAPPAARPLAVMQRGGHVRDAHVRRLPGRPRHGTSPYPAITKSEPCVGLDLRPTCVLERRGLRTVG
jgi:hypothetical protein